MVDVVVVEENNAPHNATLFAHRTLFVAHWHMDPQIQNSFPI